MLWLHPPLHCTALQGELRAGWSLSCQDLQLVPILSLVKMPLRPYLASPSKLNLPIENLPTLIQVLASHGRALQPNPKRMPRWMHCPGRHLRVFHRLVFIQPANLLHIFSKTPLQLQNIHGSVFPQWPHLAVHKRNLWIFNFGPQILMYGNKLAKLGDAIATFKSETMNHSLTDPLLTGVTARRCYRI